MEILIYNLTQRHFYNFNFCLRKYIYVYICIFIYVYINLRKHKYNYCYYKQYYVATHFKIVTIFNHPFLLFSSLFILHYLFFQDKGLPNPRRYFSYITIAIMISAWCFIFFQHSVTNVALYWLPLSNLGGLLLALYIDYDLKSVSASVNNLNNAKYVFKKP